MLSPSNLSITYHYFLYTILLSIITIHSVEKRTSVYFFVWHNLGDGNDFFTRTRTICKQNSSQEDKSSHQKITRHLMYIFYRIKCRVSKFRYIKRMAMQIWTNYLKKKIKIFLINWWLWLIIRWRTERDCLGFWFFYYYKNVNADLNKNKIS